MFKRPSTWFVLSLLCLAGAWYFWKLGDQWAAQKKSAPPAVTPGAVAPAASAPVTKTVSAATALLPRLTPGLLAAQAQAQAQATPVDPLAYRLSNTTRPLKELLRRDHALLLENALIDTETPVNFAIPPHLRGPADAGSYLVQARGPIDENFRSRLRAAGATVVAYIPNNAYLVRASTTGAAQLAAFAETQVILPYEPYYKLEAELLRKAVDLESLPDDAGLNLVLFADAAEATKAELAALGLEILAEERSPFGPVVQVSRPAQDWYAVATLPGVQTVELLREREAANDLTRVRLAVSTVPQATTNWLGLTGTNILVNVNDSWEYIAAALPEHPDLTNRVFYGTPYSLVDSNGHATHVAATIAGSGVMSPTVTNVFGSLNPGVLGQYRGMAPGASIFALPVRLGSRPFQNFGGPVSDTVIQELAAGTNAFISNNSWHYANAARYNLAAASYDAAVRDALPGVTGSQPLLYVFAAGNVGGGGDNGLGGRPDRIQSPGTAKNVISVGALELPREITNEVWKCSPINLDTNGQPICTTNSPWRGMTSEATEVAGFSSRGNTGLGVEGDFGRFKPDVVAPGTFVVSARSQYWNEAEYYNPTNYTTTTLASETVAGANKNFYSVFVPENAVGLNLTVLSARGLRIQVWKGKNPNDPVDFTKLDNQVTAPPDGGANFAPVNTTWWYSVANTNADPTQTNTYALIRTLITTNDLGNYFEVYSNLNNSIDGGTPPYYRYESGSSMAAAAVSGSLALMQEFFEQRLQRTNSPALMKALLINGARSAGPLYFSEVRNAINYQGWGVARVRNSLPSSLTNFVAGAASSMWLVDQSPTNALATGQSRTHTVAVSKNNATNQPLRVTLVWTDPPGSPAAGVKLVNNLDLIVTNTVTKEVFFGNQIEAGSNFSSPWDTNNTAPGDVVNNVENVYLLPPLDTDFTVTVRARHVNVNAVTAQTNNVVQDYALVISSGDGQVSGALTVNPAPVFLAAPEARITYVTNTFSQTDPLTGRPTASGFLLDYQRVGANTPLLGTTNGMTNQWHFYVVTNTTSFSNAAFVTFIPTELAIPRIGVREALLNNATRIEADIDLYVSTNFNLTNLSPVAVAGARQSRGRSGTEQVVLSNAVANQVYYIGVKAEDQMAADYSFFGVFSELPFGDEEGNVPCFNVPQVIPDRSPDNVQGQLNVARAICPCVLEGETRRVVVTNSFTHEHFEDLVGNVAHGQRFAVLNNHRFPPPSPVAPGPYSFVYEDNQENSFTLPLPPDPAGNPHYLLPSDGPGSLRDFVGEPRVGPWIFTFLDDAWTQTGRVEVVNLVVEEALTATNDFVLAPNSWVYDVVNVGVGATNLEVCVTGNTGPVELYVRKGGFPTATAYDKYLPIAPPGGCLQVTLADFPPLSPGRYFIGIFNPPGGTVQNVRLSARVDYDLNGVVPINWNGGGSEYLLDDAVTNSTLFVTNRARIAAVDVGVRIDHPRVSDLALTLVSPRGTRVLLMENRGMTDNLGIGSSVYVTNVVPVVVTNGGSLAVTNTIPTGRTSGTLRIDYDFVNLADRMTVYYENVRLLDTGFISGTGQLTVNYGPGSSTDVVIVMNEGGNTAPTTRYSYTVSDVGVAHSYLTFTENTNRTTTPIKFLAPPFLPPLVTPPALIPTGFEAAAAGDYVSFSTPDGWSVLQTNPVTVLNDLTLAHTGTKSLALRAGEIRRTLPTLVGRNYQLKFAYRTAPVLDGPVSWWPGQNNAADFVDGNNGRLNGATFGAGRVGQAFNFDGIDDHIISPDAPNLDFTNAMTVEAWIFPRAWAGSLRAMIGKWGGGSGSERSFSFDAQASGQGYLIVSSDGGSVNMASVSSTTLIPINQWTHIAGTYDGSTLKYYVNGQLEASVPWSQGIHSGNAPLIIGATLLTGTTPYIFFNGLIDEPALFNQALTAAEIRDIYSAGAAGKCGMVKAPPVCVPSGAQVFIPGVPINSFLGTTNWQTNTVFFTATANGTPVHLAPVSGQSGVLLDTFTLGESASSLYALPEESLRALEGENTFGLWELEIWDSRTGATNKVSLFSWQLSFVFQNEFALPEPLQPGVPQTNSVAPGQIAYHVVDVPAWARFATNILIFASGPVDVWFNQNIPPSGTNAGDFRLIGPGSTGGSRTLALASVPPLLPGRRYYLGVRNGGATTVTYALMVEFDITPLFNRVPVSDTIAVGALPRYFYYDVSSNATAVSYQLLNLSGNADLVARQGAPPPTLTDFDYGSFNSGTNDEAIMVFTNSTPVALRPGRWYLGVFNTELVPAGYTILATEYTNVFSLITLTNGIAYHATNPGPANALDYYRYRVTTNAVRARFEITNASGDMTLLARKGLPLPDLATFDYRSTNPFPNDEFIVVLNTSSPVPLTAGDWFLAAVNVSGAPVTYSIKATEWPATGQPIIITNAVVVSNEFCLTWTSRPGAQYYVQGLTSLNSTNWVTRSPTITATGFSTTWCEPLPSPFHFFRVVEGLSTASNATPVITSITHTNNTIVLEWTGPVSATYEVQWSPVLVPPGWTSFTNRVTSTNGQFRFVDNITQTGGFGVTRFYRLRQLP